MRRTLTGLLAALCTAAPIAAQQPGQGPQMVRRLPGPVAPPAFSGTHARLPMTFEQAIPVVEVLVNGRGPYRFAIDTGSSGHGRIRAALAETLGLAVGGEVRAGDGSGRSQTRRSFEPVSLVLGGVSFSGVRLSEMSAFPGRLENLDGILGLHLFGGHLLTLDYAGRQVELSMAALPESAISYTSPRGAIVVPVTIGGAAIATQIDTGNAVAPLIVPAPAAQTLPTLGQARRAGIARTGVSTVEMWEADLAAPVAIGGVAAPIRTVRYPALGENGNLGSLALSSAVLRIDQRHGRIDIRFAEQSAPADPRNEILRRERQWLDAYERHDASLMEDILAPEFVITYPSGRTMDRAAVLAQLGGASGPSGMRFRTEDTDVRVAGDSATVTGVLVMESPRGARRTRYSDSWSRRSGAWRVVASVLSEMPR